MNTKSDIICVTNRHLCGDDYERKLEAIALARPCAVILREKDMDAAGYERLAADYLEVCRKAGTRLILHYFYEAAIRLMPDGLHLPLHVLEELRASEVKLPEFKELGVSCHSVEDAVKAKELGCTYIIAGHIYDTDCKKGLPGRGLSFLREVTENTSLPVYAIGGISPENISEVRANGASGGCIMSSAMKAENITEYLELFS